MLLSAVELASTDGADIAAFLGPLSVPVYLTDEEGVITYANPACADFAGRRPRLGVDRWCVSWRLYTHDGTPLPHEYCPMAQAIREKRPVRGVSAVAERPDGKRYAFTPLPTPLFDGDGRFKGALNMFVNVAPVNRAADLLDQAEKCRRLADTATDEATAARLIQMAEEYEEWAGGLSGAG